MVCGEIMTTPQTCRSCVDDSRYKKLASSPLSLFMPVTLRRFYNTFYFAYAGAMPDRFLRRQLVAAALTTNALRPVPGSWPGIPAMFAGWLTSELAPHLLAATTAD